MKLIKSRTAWKRFVKSLNYGQPPITYEPVEYPCLVYAYYSSCAYETTDVDIYYLSDVKAWEKLLRPAQQKGQP